MRSWRWYPSRRPPPAERRGRLSTSAVSALLALVLFAGLGSGCRKKATAQQCDQLLDRFAELVVKERLPDAGTDQVSAERLRERSEAKSDDAFKNCPSEVQEGEFRCAMSATSSEALIKCLE
jgi:hypothetical protein